LKAVTYYLAVIAFLGDECNRRDFLNTSLIVSDNPELEEIPKTQGTVLKYVIHGNSGMRSASFEKTPIISISSAVRRTFSIVNHIRRRNDQKGRIEIGKSGRAAEGSNSVQPGQKRY
jgi:hypothetical protein